MLKKPLSVRVPDSVYGEITRIAQETNRSVSAIAVEALASYAGVVHVETIGDRISELERQVGELRGKLRALGS